MQNKHGLRSINTDKHIQLLRWSCRGLLVTAIVLITWLALTPSPPEVSNVIGWDKANHALAFFVLSSLSFYSQARQEWQGWFALGAYGIAIEVTQWAIGYRYFELFDIVADLFGIVLCILCLPILRRAPIMGALKNSDITAVGR